jgi:hypothetical protein
MTDQKPNRLSRKVGKIGLAIVAAVAVVIGLASPAYAGLPHFKTFSVTVTGTSGATARSATASANASAQLRFTWTEVGLGNTGDGVEYTVSTMVSVTFGCVNGGGKHPSATNKTTVTEPVDKSVGPLTVDKNGQITGSVSLDIPPVSSGDLSCPSGQMLVALAATFTHNMITDTTNDVTATDEDISVTLWP